jgi:hypothetical protein
MMPSIYTLAKQKLDPDFDIGACAERARRINLNLKRAYEHTPQRRAQHKAWEQSEAGKESYRRRNAKWRTTDNGRMKCRAKSKLYYDRHKDDPAFKERKRESMRRWRERHPQKDKELRHDHNVRYWAKCKQRRMSGEYVLWTMDGMLKVRLAA